MSEGFQSLSEREKETLRLLLGGHDIKSIAADLGLSVHTVNERLRDARRKLGASNSRQAARMLAEAEQGGAKASGDNFSGDKESGVAEATADAANPALRGRGRERPMAWLAGGMLLMSLVIAAAVVSLLMQGDGKARPLAPTKIADAGVVSSESAGSARAWLALMDSQQFKQSWSVAGSAFKASISPEGWAARAQSLGSNLGAASSRVLQRAIKTTVLPGAPDGQYEVLYFSTHFAKMGDGIERVTLAREGADWKVDGYYVDPAPARP